MLLFLLACGQLDPDPVVLWSSDPEAARVLLEALPQQERNLRVMELVERNPGNTEALCGLVEGSHRERCERYNERAHLSHKPRKRGRSRRLDKTNAWRLPPRPEWQELSPASGACSDSTCLGLEARDLAKKGRLDEAASRCLAIEGEAHQQDCFFQAAEELGRLNDALMMCRGAGSISQQCAGHVTFGLQSLPPEEARAAIAEAELGEAEPHVLALWWSHEARRSEHDNLELEPHLRNQAAMDRRELAEAQPGWVLLLPSELELERIPMGPDHPEARPVAPDPLVDQRLAELFAGGMAEEPELEAMREAASADEALIRWAAAMLLARHAPGDPLIEELAQDPDPMVAARAQARPGKR